LDLSQHGSYEKIALIKFFIEWGAKGDIWDKKFETL